MFFCNLVSNLPTTFIERCKIIGVLCLASVFGALCLILLDTWGNLILRLLQGNFHLLLLGPAQPWEFSTWCLGWKELVLTPSYYQKRFVHGAVLGITSYIVYALWKKGDRKTATDTAWKVGTMLFVYFFWGFIGTDWRWILNTLNLVISGRDWVASFSQYMTLLTIRLFYRSGMLWSLLLLWWGLRTKGIILRQKM